MSSASRSWEYERSPVHDPTQGAVLHTQASHGEADEDHGNSDFVGLDVELTEDPIVSEEAFDSEVRIRLWNA